MVTKKMILNETSYFGSGARQMIAEEVKKRGFKKAFVVTDKDLVLCGVAELVLTVLDAADIPFAVYDDVKQNPTISNVQTGLKAFAESGADFIVAVGGGSPIDTAKAIGIIANNPEHADVKSLEGETRTHRRSVPLIALPTTAGTASEVTINYVITDPEQVKKMVCIDPNDIPILAIVDAELMVSMPEGLTAATGMDALTHAIEGYITKNAWEMSDFLELKAIQLIARHLKNAVKQPLNLEARSGMALGQYIAGMAFSNVGLGIVHSMAHPLGAFYDTPHGVANALLLPYVMAFNKPAVGEKYRDIARAFGVTGIDDMSSEDAKNAAIQSVKRLSMDIGIPQALREINVNKDDFDRLALAAFNDVCTSGNPREVTPDDILGLYQEAF
jgi:lactaldehyde reductase